MDQNTKIEFIKNILNNKTLIANVFAMITSLILLLQKISMYFKASANNMYYGIPMELFTKNNKLKFYENLALLIMLVFYSFAPFIFLKWIVTDNKLYKFIIFIILINIMYSLIIFIAWKKIFKDNFKWIYRSSVILTIIVATVFYFIRNCACFAPVLVVYITLIFIFYFNSLFIIFFRNNPNPNEIRQFEIIDKTEIDKLGIKVGENSVLMVVDHIGDEMIVLECQEAKEKLLLKSKYWIIDRKGVGITVKTFAEASEKYSDIVAS